MLLWVWDAGRHHGITDDDQAARIAAAQCIVNGHAKTATVEAATLVLGVSSVTDAYQRAGVGWTGRRTDRGIRWTPLTVERAS